MSWVGLTDRASAAGDCPLGHYLTFLEPEAPASCMRLLGRGIGKLIPQVTNANVVFLKLTITLEPAGRAIASEEVDVPNWPPRRSIFYYVEQNSAVRLLTGGSKGDGRFFRARCVCIPGQGLTSLQVLGCDGQRPFPGHQNAGRSSPNARQRRIECQQIRSSRQLHDRRVRGGCRSNWGTSLGLRTGDQESSCAH